MKPAKTRSSGSVLCMVGCPVKRARRWRHDLNKVYSLQFTPGLTHAAPPLPGGRRPGRQPARQHPPGPRPGGGRVHRDLRPGRTGSGPPGVVGGGCWAGGSTRMADANGVYKRMGAWERRTEAFSWGAQRGCSKGPCLSSTSARRHVCRGMFRDRRPELYTSLLTQDGRHVSAATQGSISRMSS